MLILPGLLVFSPPCRLNKVIGFLMQFGSRQKQLNFSSLFLHPCSFPSLYHSLCCAAKALCWYWLKQCLFCFSASTFHSSFWAVQKQQCKLKRSEEETNEGSAKAIPGLVCLSASQGNMQLPHKDQVPGIGSLCGTVGCLLPLQCFSTMHCYMYCCPLLPAGAFGLKGSLEAKLLAVWV